MGWYRTGHARRLSGYLPPGQISTMANRSIRTCACYLHRSYRRTVSDRCGWARLIRPSTKGVSKWSPPYLEATVWHGACENLIKPAPPSLSFAVLCSPRLSTIDCFRMGKCLKSPPCRVIGTQEGSRFALRPDLVRSKSWTAMCGCQ
jgi:hypothetical protein